MKRRILRRMVLYPERHFTWRRLLILAAVRDGVEPSERHDNHQLTTDHVVKLSRSSRPRVTETLVMAERLGHIERYRAAHGKSMWWMTEEGQKFLRREVRKRSKLTENEDDKIMLNPVPIIRRAMAAKKKLLGIGWTERQARWVMKFRTTGKIDRVVRKAKRAERPGAYAMACLKPKNMKKTYLFHAGY